MRAELLVLMIQLNTANRKFAEHAAGSRGSGVDAANLKTSNNHSALPLNRRGNDVAEAIESPPRRNTG